MQRLRVRATAFALVAMIGALGAPAFSAAAPKPPGSGGGGGTSGTQATFVDYAQCSNGAPPSTDTACSGGWINGSLNGNNSHYREDQVVPHRLEVVVPAGSPANGRTISIEYMTRKGGVHAYDSLATWDVTQTTANRCQGLSSANCVAPSGAQPPAGTPPTSTYEIPSDPAAVPPTTGGLPSSTASHQLPREQRRFEMWGGTLVSASTPRHTNVDVNGQVLPSGDDTAVIEITYSVPDTNGDGRADAATKVQLLFGGHLAASTGPRGWGAGLGASNIAGGPYHIKWIAADGASIGSRDNQIQSSAILPGAPAFGVTKAASKATAAPGEQVEYTITVSNSGTAAGGTSFVDDYDDRITIATVPDGCIDTTQNGTKVLSCTTADIAPGGTQVFPYTATMPSTLSGPTGTPCPTGQYPVLNTVTLAGGAMAQAKVCVTASPNFLYSKTASTTTAVPGQTVTYTITVRNNGTAPGSTTFVDDYDDRLTVTPPAGCTALTGGGNKRFSCTTPELQPGAPAIPYTYTATMPASFSGGAARCAGTTAYRVYNQVLVGSTRVAEEEVCVVANATFVPSKTASPNPAEAGQVVTYTLTIRNGGNAAGIGSGTDTYDPRVTEVTLLGSGCQHDPATRTITCTSAAPIEPGASVSFQYTARMPASFTTAPNPGSAPECPNRHTVVNRFTVAGTTATHNECVTADPHFTRPTKAANPTRTTPGGSVTYTISTTNDGKAPGSVTLTDHYEAGVTVTSVPAGCTNDASIRTITCTATNVQPGQTVTFPYGATMPVTFDRAPGGGDCPDTEYPVINTVSIVGQPPTTEEVCVDADPDVRLQKAADTAGTAAGDTITYTLTYTNLGAAQATTATLTETVPGGTTLESCTGGCSVSGSTVTWTVGPIAPGGGTGSVTLTVKVQTAVACLICNQASITVPQQGSTPILSNQVCTPNSPTPNAAGAATNGGAFGVDVLVDTLLDIDLGPTQVVATSQTGPGGPVLDDDELASIAVPGSVLGVIPGGGVAQVGLIRTSSSSEVSGTAYDARSTGRAEIASVCVLELLAGPCVVEAGLVGTSTLRAVASATATGDSASTSAAGTTVQGVRVLGANVGDPTTGVVAPNTVIALDAGVFGAGSYVALNEQLAVTSTAGPNSARLEINMIRVHITSVNLGGVIPNIATVDVTVGHADAKASFPKTPICQTQPARSVSGGAVVASVSTTPALVQPDVGRLVLPNNGGARVFNLASAQLPPGPTNLVRLTAATSSTAGSITATATRSDGHAAVTGQPGTNGVCVVPSGSSCLLGATVARSEAHARAGATGATADADGSLLVGLVIGGTPVAVPAAPNTVVPIPGLGFVVVHERVCDAGSTLNAAGTLCSGANHAGMTARALRVVVTVPLPGLPIGAEIIVAEAHADATFGP